MVLPAWEFHTFLLRDVLTDVDFGKIRSHLNKRECLVKKTGKRLQLKDSSDE